MAGLSVAKLSGNRFAVWEGRFLMFVLGPYTEFNKALMVLGKALD